MKVKTECSRCSKVHFINVSAIIEALLKTIESDSVYGGVNGKLKSIDLGK